MKTKTINTRRENWPTALNNFLESRRETPFKWGQHDCTLFVADAIEAMTGADPCADLRGQWKSKMKAHRVLTEGGGMESMLANVAKDWGWKRCHPNTAQRGDLMVYAQPEGITLAICVGASAMAPAEKKGITPLPVATALYAYRVL
jgi:hypothetical protein